MCTCRLKSFLNNALKVSTVQVNIGKGHHFIIADVLFLDNKCYITVKNSVLPLPQPNYSIVMQLQTDDNASVSDFLALISAAQLTHFVLDSRMTSLVNNWLQICLYCDSVLKYS